jgi:hypothetical protein
VTSPTAQAGAGQKTVCEVEILVNKRQVQVPADTTGVEIKSKAGVPADDQLFRIEGNREIPIGDNQPIRVHHGERFVATPPIEPA